MDVKPIRTERDHRRALRRIAELMSARPRTPEFDELEVLGTLVDAWESRHHPIDPPDPVDAIRFRMEQMGLARKDLEAYIGSRARVSEVLARRRPLSLSMIRRLHRGLGIPAEVLIAD